VFLNYPFDPSYAALEHALHFAVVAAGLLPVCAKDLTAPDRPRLEMLVFAIANCHFSAHDLSRGTGEGAKNFARLNMPIETGMALYHALASQREHHRCAFFVATPHDYKEYASDLAALDPLCHDNDDLKLLSDTYEWLRRVVPTSMMLAQPTVVVREKYKDFRSRLALLNGGGPDEAPTHDEAIELMYQLCEECEWWDWRSNRAGKEEFPQVPLAWKPSKTGV
jgi:hypothetical protein